MSRAVASPKPFSEKTLRAASSSFARFCAFCSSRRPRAPPPVVSIRLTPCSYARCLARSSTCACAPDSIGGEDHLADLAAGGESLVRGLDPIERERLCNRDPDGPVLEQRQHVPLHAPHGLGLLLERADAERRCADPSPLAHERQQVDLGHRTGA